MKRFILLATLIALAFATSSCQKSPQNKSYKHKARNYTVEKGDDRFISDQVKCSLKNYYNLSVKARTTTKVTTQNGRVTIKGRVTSDNERKIVLNLVRQIPGVSGINDQLVVSTDEK